MHQSVQRLAQESKWFSEQHPNVQQIASVWHKWLFDRGSLTERLIDFSDNQFRVKVLSQRWAKPLPHEAKQLNIPTHLAARIREVALYCNDQPVVCARSVMPLKMYLEQRHILQNIGTRPLGHLLFKEGNIRTNRRQISIYFRPSSPSTQTIYGRSTPYRYHGNEILVSEFFISDKLISG